MKHIKLFEQFVESVSESKKFSDAFAVLDFFGGALPNDYSKALTAARKAGHDLPTSLYYEAAELAQDGVNENAFNNFSPEEKKGWKRAENKIGDTYFIPSDETEYKEMMRFLGSKNWRFWNTENIPGFSSDNIDPNKLPAWKSGIGFKLGGTRTGNTYVIPTEMKASTQGVKFDYDDFSKVFESLVAEGQFSWMAQDGVNESVNEGVHERRDGFYSPSDIKKLRKFAEQISDEIIDTYEDDKNIDADDYTPEEMFNYISAWGADNQMKAANLIKEFNWELLTQELGLE